MHAKITLNVIITWLCQDDEVLSIKNGLKSIGPEGASPDIYPVGF